jgi:hypothetical protein
MRVRPLLGLSAARAYKIVTLRLGQEAVCKLDLGVDLDVQELVNLDVWRAGAQRPTPRQE